MKKIMILMLALTLCIFHVGCSAEVTPETDVHETVPETVTEAVETEAPTEPVPQWETQSVYLMTAQTAYNYDGSGTYYNDYEYDEYGNLISSTTNNYDGSFLLRYDYRYDENGLLLEELYYFENTDAPVMHTEYFYDEAGVIQQEIHYDEEGNVSYTSDYTYDEAGNCIALSSKYSNWTRTYDKDGYVTEEIHEDGTHYVFNYSMDRTCVSRLRIEGTNEFPDMMETYDDNGNLLSVTYYTNSGGIKNRTVYSYNELGQLILEKKSGNSSYEVTHTYDEFGNEIQADQQYYHGTRYDMTYEVFEILVPVE